MAFPYWDFVHRAFASPSLAPQKQKKRKPKDSILPRWGEKKQRVFCFHPKRIFWHVSEARGKWNKCCVVLHFLECSATFVSAVEQMLHTSSSSTVLCNICSTLGTSIAATFVPDLGEVSATFWYVTIDHAILVPRWEQILQSTLELDTAYNICSTLGTSIAAQCRVRSSYDRPRNTCSTLGTNIAEHCRTR